MSYPLYLVTILLGLSSATLPGTIVFKCTSDPCEVQANSSYTIIADKTINTLSITCDGKTKCKYQQALGQGLIVYSSANQTYLHCKEEDSCEQTDIYCGVTPPSQYGAYLDAAFVGGQQARVEINCLSKQSCKGMEVTANNDLKQGLFVNTPEDDGVGPFKEKNAFGDGIINCGTDCVIGCRDILGSSSCKNAKCYETNADALCLCTGTQCPTDLTARPVPPTKYPTPIAGEPTRRPTPDPTDLRRTLDCEAEGCDLYPEDDFDVTCGSEFRECTVLCLEENQCANGVKLVAESAFVNIKCGRKNSCDKLQITSNVANTINMTCQDRTSCEKARVITNNPGATVILNLLGKESFKSGRVYCNSQCTLNCNGKDSCRTVKYECTSQEANCECNGDCPKDKTMQMDMFGDMTCRDQGPDCVILGNGGLRIVATKTVDTLTVICDEYPQQCKKQGNGLRIFSGAKKTVVRCSNLDGCEEVQASVGPLKDNARLPKGFETTDFDRTMGLNEKQEFLMDCSNTGACKKGDVYIADGVEATIIGDAQQSLENSKLMCQGCKDFGISCLEYTGCRNSKMDCDTLGKCWCDSIPITMDKNETAPPMPANSCPDVVMKKRAGVASVETNNNLNGIEKMNRVESSLKVVIPVIIIFATLAACIGIVWYGHKKKYSNVKGFNEMSILTNDKIYGTYDMN